jgi:non-ribosomal peptide synthetase component E (peptide arylation enzyme)
MFGEKDAGIVDLIRSHARLASRAGAICAPGRAPLSYGELIVAIDNAAELLKSNGIGSGDRIVVVLPNGPELATTTEFENENGRGNTKSLSGVRTAP